MQKLWAKSAREEARNVPVQVFPWTFASKAFKQVLVSSPGICVAPVRYQSDKGRF